MKILKYLIVACSVMASDVTAVDADRVSATLEAEYGVPFSVCKGSNGDNEVHFRSTDGRPGNAFGTKIPVQVGSVHSRLYAAPGEIFKGFLKTIPSHLQSLGFRESRFDTLREMGEFVSWFEIIDVKEGEDGSKSLHIHLYKAEFCIWDKPGAYPFVTMKKFLDPFPDHHLDLIHLWLKWLGARNMKALVVF
jgi:hypothetical protein